MTCAACVHHVGEAIRTVPGVADVSINLATARATVSLDGVAVAEPPLDELARAVADAGYRLDTAATNSDADTTRSDEERDLLWRMLVAMAGGILLLLGGFPAFPWTDGLFAAGGWWYPLLLWAVATPVQLWAGWPFYVAGFAGLRRMQPNMHTLIALGTSVAYGYSAVIVLLTWIPAFAGMTGISGHQLHFDMAAIIVALILLGRWLEARALSRASDAIGRLMDLRPQAAHLMSEDGSIEDVAVDQVAVDDTLAVRPGEQIPVDGEIISGSTEVDESALTGESMPAEKSPGDAVLTGALNGTGGFIMRATRVGADYHPGAGDPPGGGSPGFRRSGATAGGSRIGVVRAGGGTDRPGGGGDMAVRGAGAGVVRGSVAVRHAHAGGRVHHRVSLCVGAGDADGNHRGRGQGRRAWHFDSERRRAGNGASGERGCGGQDGYAYRWPAAGYGRDCRRWH